MKHMRFRFADIFVFQFLAVFPLFVTNKYKNITISKFLFFAITAFSAFVLCFIFSKPLKKVFSAFENTGKTRLSDRIRKDDGVNISFVLLIISAVISLILSPYRYSAFCGYAGRYMGFVFFIVVIFVYIFSSRYYILKNDSVLVFEGAGIIVILIAVLQFSGLNPFRLKDGIAHNDLSSFLSTIGNVNVFASYIALLLPMALYMFCFSKSERNNIVFYFISVLMSFEGVFISNSDSAYLALFFAFWLIFLLSFENRVALFRSLLALSMFFSCGTISGLVFTYVKNHYHFSNLTTIFLSPKSLVPAVILVTCAVLIKKHVLSKKAISFIKRSYIVFSATILLSVVSMIIYFSVFNKTAELGIFENYLRFNDSWGTERGLVWRLSLSAFRKMPFINKLFGYGEDTVVILLAKYYKNEMLASGYYTNNAHNEFIQYLLTMGIFGVMAYISLLVTAVKKLISRRKESMIFGALAVAVMAYAVQSFVNITQPITTPLMFLFIPFANCSTEEKQSLKRVKIKNNKKRGKKV